MPLQPGDLLLFRGQSRYSKCIRFVQALPWTHTPSRYARYTHVAVIVEPDALGYHEIVEATNRGVIRRRLTNLDMNPAPTPVHLDASSDEARTRTVQFVEAQVGDAYDWWVILSIALRQIFLCPMVLSHARHWVCSGLGALAGATIESRPWEDRPAECQMPASVAARWNVTPESE